MFKPISVQHKGAREKKKIMGHIKFQDSRLSNNPFLKFDLDLLISQLPDILKIYFCTPEESYRSHLFNEICQGRLAFWVGDIIKKILGAFFDTLYMYMVKESFNWFQVDENEP